MSNEGRLRTCRAWRAGMNPAQHRKVGYAETYARWQCDPEGIGGALRVKGVRA
jgi:hypothetical protein